MTELAERVRALRDQVLDVVATGEQEPASAPLFDAVVRCIGGVSEDDGHLLREALDRRLAYGEQESALLEQVDRMCEKFMAACLSAISSAEEQVVFAQALSDVGAQAARAVAFAALGRARRERAALLREQDNFRRLGEVASRQEAEMNRRDD